MTQAKTKRPGDVFLDRFMATATELERDAARADLYEFVGALFRIALRRAQEEDRAIRARKGLKVKWPDGTMPSP